MGSVVVKKKTPQSHMFAGRRFRIVDQKHCDQGDLGECLDSPLAIFRELKIPVEGCALIDLEVVIHEALHAACPWMAEEAVDRAAADIARLIWRLDWRKVDSDGDAIEE